MAYQRLRLHHETPRVVREFIRYTIEGHHFADIRTMLRLPLPNRSLRGGCNFAVSAELLLVIGGISTVLYTQRGTDRKKFVEVLTVHYPWAEDGGSLDPGAAAEFLYRLRNALAHNLGIVNAVRKGQGEKTVVVRTALGLPVGIGKGSLAERQIEMLERSENRPPFCMSTLHGSIERSLTLMPDALYWGTRRMIESLTRDRERMREASAFLSEDDSA